MVHSDASDRQPARGLAAASLYTGLTAATVFVVNLASSVMPGAAVILLRLVGSAILFAALARFLPRRPLPALDLGRIMALGMLGTAVNPAAFLYGMRQSTPSHAVLLYALSPFVASVAAWARGLECPTVHSVSGLLVAAAGALLLVADKVTWSWELLRGDVILLGGSLAWGLYTALSKPLLERYGTFVVTRWGTVAGAAVFLPIGIPAVMALDLPRVPAAAWGCLAWLVLVSSWAAFLTWGYAIKHLAPSRVAIFINAPTAAVVAISFAARLEQPTRLTLAGAGLVFASLAIAQGLGALCARVCAGGLTRLDRSR